MSNRVLAVHMYTLSYTVVSRKRAHGRCTLLCAQTRGWADICNIAGNIYGNIAATFYHEKAPMFTLSQPTTGYCTPTHPPSTSLIQFSVCISQACVASHKWTTFQGNGLEVPRDGFYWRDYGNYFLSTLSVIKS